jgi:5-methylcytosine-specific restriction endonuclease McrA
MPRRPCPVDGWPMDLDGACPRCGHSDAPKPEAPQRSRVRYTLCARAGCGWRSVVGGACTNPSCPRSKIRRRPHHRKMPPGWARIRRPILRAAGADERGIGGTCAVCRRPGIPGNPLEVDHIRPRALGGTDDESNLRAVHRSHNRGDGARLKERMRQRREGLP